MMSSGALLELVYWVALPVRGLLLGVLLWRKLIKEHPAFFSYILIAELCNIARVATYLTSSTAYYYTYWLSDSLVTAMALLATYELCLRRLFFAYQSVRLYRRIFPVVSALIVCAGISSNGIVFHGSILPETLVKLVHGFDVLRIAMLFFFVTLMIIMGREWKQYEFGIATGLGIDAAGFVLAMGPVVKNLPFMRHYSTTVPAIATDLACMIWLITFLSVPVGYRIPESEVLDIEILSEAKRSEGALKGWLMGDDQHRDK